MNRVFTDLQTRFDSLEKREQQALLALGGFLLLVVFYLAVWSPVNAFVLDSRADHDRHLKLLQYLRSTESQAKAATSGGQRAQGQSMLSTVSGVARSVGINPSRLQPEGGEAVSVWFDSVTFTQLMLWLERLDSSHGIVVRQITIDRRDEPGQVSARLVLR